MKNLSTIIQEYIGAVPTDKGCSTWALLQTKMEEEIREITVPKPNYDSDLLPSMRRPKKVKSSLEPKPIEVKSSPDLKLTASRNPEYEGYCVRCRSRRRMGKVEKVEMKNKRLALKGKCPICGSGMFKILGQVTT